MGNNSPSSQTAVIEISESEAGPKGRRVFRKSNFHLVPSSQQKPPTASKTTHAKKPVVDRRITNVTDGAQELQAVRVDLDFELFTRGEPTPAVLGKIVHRYWRVAQAAMQQQRGQHVLVVILEANPATIAKVRNNRPEDLCDAIYQAFLHSKTELLPLRVEVRAKQPTPAFPKEKAPPGPVGSEEIMRLLGNLRAPGSE